MTKSLLERANASITADPASARRHWKEVAQNAAIRSAHATRERDRQRYDFEVRVALAALDQIALKGRAPRSLFLGEAAAELGLVE